MLTFQIIFHKRFWAAIIAIYIILWLVTSCTNLPSQPNLPLVINRPDPVENALIAKVPYKGSIYLPLVANQDISIWVAPYLPAVFVKSVRATFSSAVVDEPVSESIKIEVGDQNIISKWIYALVTPFPSVQQNISNDDLIMNWQGKKIGPYANSPLLMDESTYKMLSAIWGPADPDKIKLLDPDKIIEYAWANQPSWAVIPFEALEPRWKVLAVDGRSPISKNFKPDQYFITIPISFTGNLANLKYVKSLDEYKSKNSLVLLTNRDPDKLTTLAITGVTALVRATAYSMEQQGITYPSRDIRDWLRNADLTHISNEVPFAENCPFPNPSQSTIRFCSRDSYIGLLEDAGTDIVELSGDHLQDWGKDAMLHTLKLYQDRGWSYYGGGKNLEDGRKALLIEHNGNRLAFIGCNAKGSSFAHATETDPGAVACDMNWIKNEIIRLKQKGYLPIVTFQHQEYYTYAAQPDQKRDFQWMAEAGAVIVSGSQAHQPQGMEFFNQAFIHYGLGNLFFDQYDLNLACRQATIDRHVFYNGRYISVELLPIQFVDYSRSRPMTTGEASSLFKSLFAASGWQK
jgi:poly-gamma-glutamate synthesis protein (capsule biosynthesis protein)